MLRGKWVAGRAANAQKDLRGVRASRQSESSCATIAGGVGAWRNESGVSSGDPRSRCAASHA
eukprot:15478759-Alexandrium_andersonii.AAC.1